jgi:hypothetical protein
MALSHGPSPIVTNGLVLALDAADRNSYPGSGTTWTDLSDNGKNGTLRNGPTYNSGNLGSIVFDGTNDDVYINNFNFVTNEATFLCWVKSNGIQETWRGFIFTRNGPATGINVVANNDLGYHWNDQYYWIVTGLVVPSSNWCMCALSVTSTAATVYLGTSSGLQSYTNVSSHSSITLNDLYLGRDPFQFPRYFNGNIAQGSAYNRALTAAEIQQNFNATRSRFGI